MRFDDAKMCVLLDRLDLFSRKPDVLEKYEEYLRATRRNGIDVRDVIAKKMGGHRIAWMKNEYPYDVDDATHYLIWSTDPLDDGKIDEIISRHIGGREVVRFVNPENLKSVQDLWHCHVLISTNNNINGEIRDYIV
ncbi:protein of unknown function (DUF3605) [Paramecium bursaria Chlorella virus NE-JV-1]|nr:protein of unknown function (DUF3605) [Paramecium bursaria Chlorella virus NE-JV-1]